MFPRVLTALAAVVAGSLALVAPAPAAVSFWSLENPDYFGVANDTGVFWFAKHCFMRYGVNSIGPGYIFSAGSIDADGGWRTKTEDVRDYTVAKSAEPTPGADSLSDPRNGGWAKFGFHLARKGVPGPKNGHWIKEVSGGTCLGNTNQEPSYRAGVSSSSFFIEPRYVGAEAEFAIAVNLGDELGDLIQVVYHYLIDSTRVRLWTSVTNLCPNGTCGPGTVYYKEPKFIVSDYGNSSPYNLLLGVTTTGYDSCEWPGIVQGSGDPTKHTLQCAEPEREQVWFKYDNWADVNRDCRPLRCTWVIARAATGGGPGVSTPLWYGTGYGLDGWAQLLSQRDSYGTPTQDIDPSDDFHPSASCGKGFDSFRRWEIGRWSATPEGSTVQQAGFHGWEGGAGPVDCLNLFKQPTGALTFYNYFEFSFR